MGGLHSKNKGKVGEREFAREINTLFDIGARRTAQCRGTAISGDVECEAPVLWEVKRTARSHFHMWSALKQASEDSDGIKIPAVAHRCDNEKWIVIVELDHLPEFVRAMRPFIKEKTECQQKEKSKTISKKCQKPMRRPGLLNGPTESTI